MIGDLSGVKKIYLITGFTDMRKSVDGLMGLVKDVYDLDPYANAAFFFCGRRADRIKVLHFEPDGMTLLYHRLDAGRYHWPRNRSEALELSRQQLRWLLEGLEIEQKCSISKAVKRDF